MLQPTNFMYIMKYLAKIYILFIILNSLFSCDDPNENTTYQVYDVNPISTYLESRPDDFSEWISVLKYADLFNAINFANQNFTAFVPNNDAVLKFYKRKGVKSIEELGYNYARNLAQYHILSDSITSDMLTKGDKIDTPTLSEDYLSVSFGDDGFNSVMINKEAKALELEIRTSNGFVYVLDAVLSPLTETVYDRVKESVEPHNILLESLQLTSWKDSLSVIADTILQSNGSKRIVRRNYTLLSVSDDILGKNGITNIEDLKKKLGAGNDYTNPKNALFKYVAYHIIEGSQYFSDLKSFNSSADKSKLWNTKAKNELIQISLVDGNYYINHNDVKASFIEDKIDVVAKNGVVHGIDSYLPVWTPDPVTVIFDVCDYPIVANYIETDGTEGQKYQVVDASNEYRTEVTKLSCYKVNYTNPASTDSYNYVDYFTAKAGNAWKDSKNGDMLILNLGYTGSIMMETPAIIKGKYKVTLHFGFAGSQDFMRLSSGGSNGGSMEFSFDNTTKATLKPYTTVPSKTLGNYSFVLFDEVDFSETTSHQFKIVLLDPAASTNSSFRVYIDYLLFEPI